VGWQATDSENIAASSTFLKGEEEERKTECSDLCNLYMTVILPVLSIDEKPRSGAWHGFAIP
jgi:hypothetical protein